MPIGTKRVTDRLDAMQAFITVCDAHGFAAASRKLGLSTSVVTRLVAGLEAQLGVRLLQRTTRSVKLTDTGARFLERARRIVAEVEEAVLSAQEERDEPSGCLVVAAPPLFGRLHVRPVISRYLAKYPKVSAELCLSSDYVHLIDEGIDLAIRVGNLADSGLVMRGLGQTRQMLAASPDYLARHGEPRSPAELPAHRLIAFRGITPRREWPFLRDGVAATVVVEPQLFCTSGEAALEHAIAGGGIVVALSFQMAEARRVGQLVEVLRDFAPPPVAIQALFPTARLLSKKVRAFLELLDDAAVAWDTA
jgi:DNA-binding transcriptional LysR family regulator